MEKRDGFEFEFDSSGEVVAYISLEQAVLLARQMAREDTEHYRGRLDWEEIVWSVQSSEKQGEDLYRIVLQFRRPQRQVRRDQTGEEEFVFDLTGKLEFRQVLAWPEPVQAAITTPTPCSAEQALNQTASSAAEMAPRNARDRDRGHRYQTFFQDMLDQIQQRRPGITKVTRAGNRNYLPLPSGRSGFGFPLVFASGHRFRFELYMDTGSREANKHAFDAISMGKDAVEGNLGANLEWERLETRRGSRISWVWEESVSIMDGPEKIRKLKQWVIENYFRFRDALSSQLDELPSSFEVSDVGEGAKPTLTQSPVGDGS